MWKRARGLVLDCETSGLTEEDRILEVGYAVFEDGRVLESGSWLVNPGLPALHPKITEVTGLTLADLTPHEPFQSHFLKLQALLGQALYLVAYNAPFDQGMFRREFQRLGFDLPDLPWLDPLVWIHKYDKFKKGKKLTQACERRNIKVDGAHRAHADVLMTVQLMFHPTVINPLPDSLGDLLELQQLWRRQQEADFAAWRAKQAQLPPKTDG